MVGLSKPFGQFKSAALCVADLWCTIKCHDLQEASLDRFTESFDIATKVNGIPEVVGQVGTLLEPKQPEQLADAMKNAYMLPVLKRDEIAHTAYRHVYDNFSIPAFNKQFWNLPLLKTLEA